MRISRVGNRVQVFGGGHNAGGFTLIELLVVLVLVALCLTVVPPYFSKALASVEVKAGASRLAAALREVRAQAVARQHEEALGIDVRQRRYTLLGSNRFHDLPTAGMLKVFGARTEQSTVDDIAIRFYPDGSATGGRITLIGPAARYVVDVDWLTGRVRLLY